jgi:hypothetical protein
VKKDMSQASNDDFPLSGENETGPKKIFEIRRKNGKLLTIVNRIHRQEGKS